MMDFPKPPQDIELKNIIDKLAQFVARNGPDFEEMTKNKQKGNPKFDFLFGGEHYHYYRYKVNSEQAFMNAEMTMHNAPAAVNIPSPWLNPPPPSNLQADSLTAQQVALNDQIRESETNLNAQHEVMLQQQRIQIEEAITKVVDNELKNDAIDCGIDFNEFDNVLQPIIDTCTKDAISAGKSWIIQRATAPVPNSVIAKYLLKKVLDPNATFNKRLHIIYLLNDTLHHCLRRNADELRKSLEDVVVPMFCTAASSANDDQQQKLQKLLNLWENKNHYFSKEIIEKLKNPIESIAEYKAELLEKNSDIVEQITNSNESTYQHYQSQHQAFVNHALQQIQNLEKQKHQLMQSMPPHLPPPGKDPRLMKYSTSTLSDEPSSPTSLFPVSMQPSPLNNVSQPPDDQKSHLISPKTSHSHPPPLMHNFDPRHHNRAPPNDLRSEAPLSERLAHIMQTQVNHDPRLQSGAPSYRNQNKDQDRFHQNIGPNTKDPPPPPSFKPEPPPMRQDMPGLNHHVNNTNNFQDIKSAEVPFNQPPPSVFQGAPQAPPSNPPMAFPPTDVALPDLSRPPPNFNNGPSTPAIPPLMSLPPPDFLPDDLLPSLPYYDLPAGLMVPLVKLEDSGYKALNPEDIRLPPPAPPSERLLAAVKAFYTPPGHDRPRDSEGWEKLGLYEYYRAKGIAKQQKQEDIIAGRRIKSRSPSPIIRAKSRSRSPVVNRKRYRSRSRSKSKERRSRSPPPSRSKTLSNSRRSPPSRRSSNRERRRDRSRSKSRSRSRSRSRSSSPPVSHQDIQRSPTPPSFLNSSYSKLNDKLDESNKGHQLLRKMGWGGAGLGAKEQGIEAPISAGEVRDRTDQYKGVGINLSDPYENFRKSKGQAFITRMKERAEERLANTG